jgi:hypothetical protein
MGPVDSRTLRVQGSSTRSTPIPRWSLRRRINRRQAAEAKSSTGWETVVRCGLSANIQSKSSKPTSDVAKNFQAEAARGLDRAQRADIGEGEDRGRPVGATKLELDRGAQGFEVMSAVDDALAPLEPCFGHGAAGAGDAVLDVLEPLRMG